MSLDERPETGASADGGGERTRHVTPRELQILLLVAEGFVNRRIATELGISPSTVRGHLARVRARLQIRDRTQAARSAIKLALQNPDPAKGSQRIQHWKLSDMLPREGKADELIVAIELVPEGGLLTIVVRPGEPAHVRLHTPVRDDDGTVFTGLDIVVDRLPRREQAPPAEPPRLLGPGTNPGPDGQSSNPEEPLPPSE